MLKGASLSMSMLALLAHAAWAGADLELSPPLAEANDRHAPPLHLFVETLRVPFGEDWGGETFLYAPVSGRLSLGLFLRAWNEAICASPSCAERATEAGIELRYQARPGLDVGVGMGLQRSGAAGSTPAVLPRVHLKF